MARIAGVELNNQKAIWIALTAIKGIGRSSSMQIIEKLNIDQNLKPKDLTEQDIKGIREIIEANYKVEGDLNLEVSQNIRRLKESCSYRGDRHKKNLPAYGQRTKTNARTKRGRRVTVGSGRKSASEKT